MTPQNQGFSSNKTLPKKNLPQKWPSNKQIYMLLVYYERGFIVCTLQ